MAKRDGIDLAKGWHFVVGTYGPSGLKFYFDGNLKSTQTNAIDLNSYPGPLYIGRDWNAPGEIRPRYFYGALDNVMIFNKELTAAEILELFNLQIK